MTYNLNTYWLKELRCIRNISQGELAKKINYAQSVISEVEAGKKPLTMRLFLEYCRVFDISPSDLMTIIQKKKRLRINSTDDK